MGQMTVGVLYGVKEPKGVDLYGNDDSLVLRYEQARGHAPQADQGDGGVVGFWVAVGSGGGRESDCADLEAAVALDDIPDAKPYAMAYRRAWERWAAFDAWCTAQGVTLPPARLWLALTEVA